MAKAISRIEILLDFGGSGTKVAATCDGNRPIFFLMPPHCTEISAQSCIGEYFDENSVWVSCDDTYYAVGVLAEQFSSSSINVKPLKVESALPKTLAAIAIAAQKLGIKKFRLAVSIVLPSGESQQRDIYSQQLNELLGKNITSPWGSLKIKLIAFTSDIEGKGILLFHRQVHKTTRNTMVLMLGYRNASFIATKGKIVSATSCSDIGFQSFLKKVVSLTSGYSLEKLLPAVSHYRLSKSDSALNPVLRFSLGSPFRDRELTDLKAAIVQAEVFYIGQLLNWLQEFLSVDVDEVVLAGGSASYIGLQLAEKLTGRVVPSDENIFLYEVSDLPLDIAQIDHGDRFLDIYGIWREVSAM